jgi:AcrR family transcriptional regulator
MDDPEMPVRDRLLLAAKRLFAEKGFARASISDITSAAGVTKPMLYYYFDGKDGLLQALMDRAYERLDAGLATIAARGLSPAAQLGAIAELTCEMAREDPDVSRFCIGLEYGPRGELPKVDIERLGLRTFEALITAADAGVRAGELDGDPFEIAGMVYGSVQLQVLAQLARPELTFLTPGRGERLTSVLVRGIAGPKLRNQ